MVTSEKTLRAILGDSEFPALVIRPDVMDYPIVCWECMTVYTYQNPGYWNHKVTCKPADLKAISMERLSRFLIAYLAQEVFQITGTDGGGHNEGFNGMMGDERSIEMARALHARIAGREGSIQ